MNADFITQAILLVVTNAVTAWITNSSAKKKYSAEASNYISLAYTKLVDDLQNQIEILKAQIEKLDKENAAMQVQIKDMGLKIKNLEHENKSLKKSL